jgi:hypothetical protein
MNSTAPRFNIFGEFGEKPDFSRFYLHRPNPGQDLCEIPIARLLGSRVLLDRVSPEANKIGRFFFIDTYQAGSVMFKVLAVGNGEWRPVGKKKRMAWIEPEVQPGDVCVSHHFFRASEHPDWYQPVYLDDPGGLGRVALDCRFAELAWNPKQKEQNEST